MKINKQYLTFAILFGLFFLAFYIKYVPQELSLVHGFPTTTESSDAIFHALETEWIAQDEIHYRMAPFQAVGYENVYDGAPPQLYIGAAFFTALAGIESYDAIFLLGVLMFAAAVMGTYLLLSKFFGQLPAILASLMIIFPLNLAFHYMMEIGWYHQIASMVFFPVVPYLLYRALEKNRIGDYILIALCISASMLAHTIEGAMLLAFVAGALVIEALEAIISRKKVAWKGLLLNYSTLLLPILIMLQQLWVTKYMYASVGGLFGGKIPAPFSAGLPPVTYTTMHVLTMALAGIGAFFFLYSLKRKEFRYLGLWFLVFLLGFFSNWVGLAFWFERIRYTSYLLFYPLAGIGVFFISKFTYKKYRPIVWVAAFAIVLFLGLSLNIPQVYGERPHLLNQEMYDALLWLQDNTPEDSTVIFFDGYWQGTAAYCRRLGTDLRPDDIARLAEPEMIEVWNYTMFGYHQKLPYKTGLFSFGNYEDIYSINVCETDYKIFVNYQQLMPALEKYERKLMETNEVVYNQNGIMILADRDGKAGCLS